MQIMKDYKWATHIPLIKGILDLYKPDWVLESGVGMHSTPLFKGMEYIGIENDSNWIEKIKADFPDMDIRYHDIPRMDIATRHYRISKLTKLQIMLYYTAIDIPTTGKGLLFVDGFTGVRRLAVNSMIDNVDIVIIHDSQPRSRNIYAYEKINEEGFTKYSLTSPSSWTTVLVREDKGLKELQDALAPHIKEFIKQWPKAKKMYVINEW